MFDVTKLSDWLWQLASVSLHKGDLAWGRYTVCRLSRCPPVLQHHGPPCQMLVHPECDVTYIFYWGSYLKACEFSALSVGREVIDDVYKIK